MMNEHKRCCPNCGRLCQPIGYEVRTTQVCFECRCGQDFVAERQSDYLAGVGDVEDAEAKEN